MNGQISVLLEGGENEYLHFQFGTLAEFYLGMTKQRMGFSPYEELHQEISMGLLFNAAIDAYNDIHKIHKEGVTISDNLAILDRVKDSDKEKVLEVANNSMGFINTALRKMMQELARIQEATNQKPPAPMKSGLPNGKKGKGSHLGGLG